MSESSNVTDVVDIINGYVESNDVEKAVSIFNSLDPPNAMDVVIRLDSSARRKIFAVSNLENLVEVLARLPDEIVYGIASVRGVDDIVKLLAKLPVDEIADVLYKLPSKTRLEILKLLPPELSSEVGKIMRFPPESVGGIMTTRIPVFEDSMTVGEAIDIFEESCYRRGEGV